MRVKIGVGVNMGGVVPGGSDFLDGVLDSVCCDLDATIAASYGGTGQTWANLTTSPADGAGRTDYDFFLGADGSATTDDPTFTGSAGDPAAYFALDGGDYFQSKTFSAMTTLFNLHKSGTSGQQWWVAMAYRHNSLTIQATWGTGWTAADIGWYGYNDPDGVKGGWGLQGGSSWQLNNADAGLDYGQTDDVLLIISIDSSIDTGNTRIWTVSTTNSGKDEATPDFGTDNDNAAFTIGASYDEGTYRAFLPNGARIYSFACGNEYLTDAKAALIFTHMEARHDRDYTP